MPSQGLSYFKPNCDAKLDTVYITIMHFDEECGKKYVADNLPHPVSHAVIVTATGDVVDAKKDQLWIDMEGKDHRKDPCTSCKSMSSICTVCLVESRMEQIQKSIGVIQSCKVAQTLISTIEEMGREKFARKRLEAQELMSEVEALAKEYWTLESKTKRSVRDVKAYGENLKEAAEDYLNDNIINDFWQEMSDMKDVKKSLEEANDTHEV